MGGEEIGDEEIKFEMVKKIIGVDPLTVPCTFCMAQVGQQCKNGLYQKINMPHSGRWKARIEIDKPVVKKLYRVTAEIRERILVGDFEAVNAEEAMKQGRMCKNETVLHDFEAEEIE